MELLSIKKIVQVELNSAQGLNGVKYSYEDRAASVFQ